MNGNHVPHHKHCTHEKRARNRNTITAHSTDIISIHRQIVAAFQVPPQRHSQPQQHGHDDGEGDHYTTQFNGGAASGGLPTVVGFRSHASVHVLMSHAWSTKPIVFQV